MRQHIKNYIEIYVIAAFFLGIVILCITINGITSAVDASSMRKLGYEAKVVNLDCFAKYQGRWLLCKAVASNQIEVTKTTN